MKNFVSEQEFLDKLKKTYSLEQYENIIYAFNYAKNAHAGQKRQSGEDYFIHPYLVADILVDLGLDYTTIIAALLHDILEDTAILKEELLVKFGDNIVQLVEGVTKLAKIKFLSIEDEQAENLRKMLIAMSTDIRVIIIKLADRLHNMRSLNYLSEARQQAIAKETLEIYAPLAARLGISKIKCELEDLCMRYMHPKAYKELVELIPIKRKERQETVERVIHELADKLKEIEVNGEVNGRPKHFYSIYKKMQMQNKTIDQIYDLIAVRVIVNDIKDCYAVLGAVHTMYKPLPGRFKDYISVPKPNMYESLHTTVMTSYGMPFEIQIRTVEMHKIAEYGIAAHWKYKEGNRHITNNELDKNIGWIRDVIDSQTDTSEAHDLMDSVKIDVFESEVFVFTPKGKAINLPAGSTLVDFAYHIHSKVGDRCVGGKVNSRIVPLNSKLKNGDIVEILTSNASKGPSRDWLNFVKSPATKSKIRQFFKRMMKEENIKIGKDILERETKRKGYALSSPESIKVLESIVAKYSLPGIEEVYARVGFGELNTVQIINKIVDANRELEKKDDVIEVKPKTERKKPISNILIKGYDGFLIKISKCCNPVPHDEIIGYISRGRGVSVHRVDCPNLAGLETDRKIEASWAESIKEEFVAILSLLVDNRKGIIAELSTLLSNNKININSINAKTLKSGEGLISLSIELSDTEMLEHIIKKINAIRGVIDVRRY